MSGSLLCPIPHFVSTAEIRHLCKESGMVMSLCHRSTVLYTTSIRDQRTYQILMKLPCVPCNLRMEEALYVMP